MDRRGYLTVGRWRGVPIRVHVLAPLGAVFFTGGSVSLVRVLLFLGIILVHELGHAILVRRFGARVVEITLHFMGGECTWMGQVDPIARALIAFGGVFAQLLLAGVAILLPLGGDLADMLVMWNLINAAFNLLPIGGLDGREAWKLFPLLFKRLKRRRKHWARNEVESELKKVLARAAQKTRKMN